VAGDPNALRDRRMCAQESDRAGGVGEIARYVARGPVREAERRDARRSERFAHEPAGFDVADAASKVRDATDGLAVRQMKDALDLRSRDREGHALQH
jgi:hypothetical protein